MKNNAGSLNIRLKNDYKINCFNKIREKNSIYQDEQFLYSEDRKGEYTKFESL